MNLTRADCERLNLPYDELWAGARPTAPLAVPVAAKQAGRLPSLAFGEPTAEPPGVHRLILLNWRPTPLNRLVGHHMRAARLKRADRLAVEMAARAFGTPKATGKRRVDLIIRPAKGQKRTDPDSPWKSALDALVHAGLLLNDTHAAVEQGTHTPTLKGMARTEIVLTDLNGGTSCSD